MCLMLNFEGVIAAEILRNSVELKTGILLNSYLWTTRTF